jgi:hypothetical protein
MKISLIIILSLFIGIEIFAQEMVWAKTMGGTFTDVGRSVAVDVNGNVYTTGSFRGTVDFDPGLGVFNLTSAGNDDIYIQKLDANGNFLWCKKMGGANLDQGTDIAIDGNGNIYTTGSFYGTVDFDPGISIFNLTTTSTKGHAYIQKLDANGNLLWVKKLGGAGHVGTTSLAIDANNNVYTTAYFTATLDFDPGSGIFNLTSVGDNDIYIQKLDVNGDFIWARRVGGQDVDIPNDIVIDANSNVYVVGRFEGTADFDPSFRVFNLVSLGAGVGAVDAFVLKLDVDGIFIWAKRIGGATSGTIHAYANAVAVDADQNVYTTGDFSSIVDFDPGAGVFSLTARGTRDMFVQKLDVNGSFVWANRIGQPGTLWLGVTEGENLVVDANANVYITGSFKETTDFDPGLGFFYLSSYSYYDGFIQKVDANGNLIWAKQIGGAADGDVGYDIAVDMNNNVYALGLFRQTVDFDLGAGVFNVTSQGDGDIYIMKLEQCGSNRVDNVSSCAAYTWIDGNTYTSNTTTAIHRLTNAAGCDSIISLDLTIDTVNTLISLLGNTLRTTNSGAIYQWIDCNNNTIISGATGQSFTPTANGSYGVIITNNNNCIDTSNCISVVLSGIEHLSASSSVQVYPNPTPNYLIIELPNANREIQIEVVDVNGKLVLNQNYPTSTKIKLLVHDLTTGVYFVKIKSRDDLQVIKIIKE